MANTKKTNLRKYGVTCSLHSKEGIKKKKETWLKKYRVDNPAKDSSVIDKAINTIKNKDIAFYSSMNNWYYSNVFKKSLYYQSKNELDFIIWCENNKNIKDVNRSPMIRIKTDNKNICITCDFLITYTSDKNRLVEIKGNHPGWWEDKKTNRWNIEKKILENYSNSHNYLKFFLLFNNRKETYERIQSDKN